MLRFKSNNATFPIIGITIFTFIIQVFSDTFTKLFYLDPKIVLYEPWRLITSMFLHGSPMHLFFNMYVLLMFGPVVESKIGKKRFLILYFLSGIIASIGYSLFPIINLGKPALGASGAIMGLLGVTIILLPNLRVLFFFILPMKLRTAGIIIALMDVLGMFNSGSNVAHLAHLFGLATGLLFGWYLIKQKIKFQTSFGILKKYSNIPMKNKNNKTKKHKPEVKDADFQETIELSQDDIDNYIKNGRL